MVEGLIEPVFVPDTYCSGVGGIEDAGGGNLRLYFYALQVPIGADSATSERMVVMKGVIPREAIPEFMGQIITALGGGALKLRVH